jgi:hypothetical protein
MSASEWRLQLRRGLFLVCSGSGFTPAAAVCDVGAISDCESDWLLFIAAPTA